MKLAYPAVFEKQSEGGFCVSFPDFNEAITEGDTLDEAMMNAQEVLSLTISGRIDEGMDIPEPSAHKNARLIIPNTQAQAALLVKLSRGERPLSDLARALNTSWPSAQKLEDPNHWPSLRQLDKAARALGKKLVLSFE